MSKETGVAKHLRETERERERESEIKSWSVASNVRIYWLKDIKTRTTKAYHLSARLNALASIHSHIFSDAAGAAAAAIGCQNFQSVQFPLRLPWESFH